MASPSVMTALVAVRGSLGIGASTTSSSDRLTFPLPFENCQSKNQLSATWTARPWTTWTKPHQSRDRGFPHGRWQSDLLARQSADS